MSYFTRVSIKDISGNTIKIHEDHDGSKRLGVGAHLVNQEGRHVYISSQQELLTYQRIKQFMLFYVRLCVKK